jgi:hypothetical protein
VADFSRCRTIEDIGERLYDGWRRALDRRGTRTAWKRVNREVEAVIEAGVPGIVRASVRGRRAGRGARPLPRLHALLAMPEMLATERRVLVVFDEFQDLLTAGDDLDGLVRSHVQHHAGLASYCYAGSQASLLRALFEDRQRPLFGQAREVALSPFPVEEIADWVGERFAAAGRPLPAGSAPALAAAGHPQRQVLGAVAEGENRLLAAGSLESMGLGKSTAQQARDVLEAEGHLRRDGRTIAVTDPFLARWFG